MHTQPHTLENTEILGFTCKKKGFTCDQKGFKPAQREPNEETRRSAAEPAGY